MGLYLGTSKVKLLIGNEFRKIAVNDFEKIVVALHTSDDFILQDADGLSLISGDYKLPDATLKTIDYYTLIDLKGKYLTTKEVL